jgi:dienelactone hydrolase
VIGCRAIVLLLALASIGANAQTPVVAPAGQVKGTATVHDDASAAAAMAGAQVALPASATGGALFEGRYDMAPRQVQARVPVVVFLHGSSGLGLKAIGEWQRWLAGLGIASIAPDSFALRDRVTYTSPVDVEVYERIHALRASEIALALKALVTTPWADMSRLVLAGTSEGATAVARYAGGGFAGRVIYSWSCENNYFVKDAATAATEGRPVLNIISASDPFFSPANPWLGNAAAKGHCADALKANKEAVIVLLEQAPHTLINLPAARAITEAFLKGVLRPS